MVRNRTAARGQLDAAAANFELGAMTVRGHPLFGPLWRHAYVRRGTSSTVPSDAWVTVADHGSINAHPTRRGAPEEWAYVLAHALLHLGLGHFPMREHEREWNMAGDLVIARFLAGLKLGRPPEGFLPSGEFQAATEEQLYAQICERGAPVSYSGDMRPDTTLVRVRRLIPSYQPPKWQDLLGQGLSAAVTSAVNVAAGVEERLGVPSPALSPAQRARSWFISSYPLLGALAAGFTLIEDARLCARMQISVAAVDPLTREIYVNPAAGLDTYECRFVIAHELLHVGLRHGARCQGRDPFLWNAACDYVINGWLVEMGVGTIPSVGLLYDPALKGESAESVYDRIVTDVRRARKLATLRGRGLGDMLERDDPRWWTHGEGMDLDEFYRSCLSRGLSFHDAEGRGLLPSGLVEEVRALGQPPIPWDVQLAAWFERHFAPLETVRSYARPSRRQSATPDIPRPRAVPAPWAEDGRTFGVLLDTSGSMDRTLLAKALGAIASYSVAHDVPAVRVVFCDAATYDQGYMPPDAIAGSMKVRGRGGTVLQPGIEVLERAEDFPPDGPLLVITDGYCDRLRIRREHAFLLPEGRQLPFPARGPVFRLQ